jgi:hypothetical protein
MLSGNTWGFAGAVPGTHGSMLLLGDPRSINRLVAVVADVSGAGDGVRALSGSIGYDLVPDRLNATVGVATATNGRAQPFGTEVNAKLVYRPAPLLDLGVYSAVVAPGAASGLDTPPWIAQVAMDWVVF